MKSVCVGQVGQFGQLLLESADFASSRGNPKHVTLLGAQAQMSDFPREYGSLPDLKEQARIWLATLPAGIVSFYGPIMLDRLFAVEGHAMSFERLPFLVLAVTFCLGAVFGCFDRRFESFEYPVFSVTWRSYVWTLVVAAIPYPLMVLGIIMLPHLSLAGWIGMPSGYFVAARLSRLLARRRESLEAK